jgi:hypothetical protein
MYEQEQLITGQSENSFFIGNISVSPYEVTTGPLKNKGKIDDILDRVKVDPVVKDQAKIFYEGLNINTIRLETKLMAIFYCILTAQEFLGEEHGVCPAADLGEELELTQSQREAAIKKFQGRLEAFPSPVGYVDPLTRIKSAARQMNWQQSIIDEISAEWKDLVNVNSRLENIQPNRIAAAYISYYIKSRGCTVDSKELANFFKISVKHLDENEKLVTDTVIRMRNVNK